MRGVLRAEVRGAGFYFWGGGCKSCQGRQGITWVHALLFPCRASIRHMHATLCAGCAIRAAPHSSAAPIECTITPLPHPHHTSPHTRTHTPRSSRQSPQWCRHQGPGSPAPSHQRAGDWRRRRGGSGLPAGRQWVQRAAPAAHCSTSRLQPRREQTTGPSCRCGSDRRGVLPRQVAKPRPQPHAATSCWHPRHFSLALLVGWKSSKLTSGSTMGTRPADCMRD